MHITITNTTDAGVNRYETRLNPSSDVLQRRMMFSPAIYLQGAIIGPAYAAGLTNHSHELSMVSEVCGTLQYLTIQEINQ
jgi:hypothetical protein